MTVVNLYDVKRIAAPASSATYYNNLCEAMQRCVAVPNSIFLGQGVGVPGTSMSSTFRDVPDDKRIEMPVAEDMQMGMATGMALAGYLPICIFPRWNFLICATNQIVNHLDRLVLYSGGGYRPKVIIRVAVPSVDPFYPGPQHDDDFTAPFRLMCRTIKIITLRRSCEVVPQYDAALKRRDSTILVEFTENYKGERAKEHK